MALFESYERRIDQINAELKKHGINSIEEAKQICDEKGVDAYGIAKSIQPICFENAGWAYTVGAAIAIKDGVKTAAEAAEKIGLGLQSFCIPGSVADDRKVGLGHGNLGAMLLRDETTAQTRREKNLCALFLTVLERTLQRLFQELTALHMFRLSLTIIQANLTL